MAEVGYAAVVFTLIVSAYTTGVLILNTRRPHRPLLESGRNGIFLAAAFATLASGILLYLLFAREFGTKYVFEHVSTYLAPGYTVSAFWAGQEGSLLLWMWLVALLAAVMVARKWAAGGTLGSYVLVVLASTQAFLALVLILAANPFQILPVVPDEGQGLNPLLENFWMVVHPPVIFMGYASYTVPFAVAIAGLIGNQMGREWVQEVRRWALLAWLLLGVGILLGAWWAYLELGWGGYWAWDPVENSSLIPWLTGTALLHSLMMQERRNAFRIWNLSLISLTFVLCIFATFVTRSGIIQSVHAFGSSSVGQYFAAFMVLSLLITAYLMYIRRRELASQQDLGTFFSRESSLLFTNLLFAGVALTVLLGTIFPAVSELLQGRQAAVDASFYERTVGPLGQVVVLLIGICPWLVWGGTSVSTLRRGLLPSAVTALVAIPVLFILGVRAAFAVSSFAICVFVATSIVQTFRRDLAARHSSTGEGYLRALVSVAQRSRRRYGGYVVHLGVVLLVVGITGSSAYQTQAQVVLSPSESTTFQGYTLQYEDLIEERTAAKQRLATVLGVYRGERRIATVRPEKNFHWNVEQWVTEVSIYSTLKEDLYISLAGLEEDGLATLQVLVNPLVVWLWIGGAVLLVGAVIAWWPSASGARRT